MPYTFCENRRIRALSLAIAPWTGLVVSAPPESTHADIHRFLTRHQQWVTRQWDRLIARGPILPRWPYGTTLPYLGREYPVRIRPIEGSGPRVRLCHDAVQIGLRTPAIPAARRLLKRWYLDEASRWLTHTTALLGRRFRIAWTGIRIGDQRSRWGSCSSRGRLSFNYRLVMAPPAVMEYVVVHELLHRREPNHSKRFWRLVEACDPAYRESLLWLRRYGPSLGV